MLFVLITPNINSCVKQVVWSEYKTVIAFHLNNSFYNYIPVQIWYWDIQIKYAGFSQAVIAEFSTKSVDCKVSQLMFNSWRHGN